MTSCFMAIECHFNHWAPYSPQYRGVVASLFHQGGTPCQSQSKFSRGLWVLWLLTPELVSYNHPHAFKTRWHVWCQRANFHKNQWMILNQELQGVLLNLTSSKQSRGTLLLWHRKKSVRILWLCHGLSKLQNFVCAQRLPFIEYQH